MTNVGAGVCAIKEEFLMKQTNKNFSDDNTNASLKHKLEASGDDGSSSKKTKNDEKRNKKRGQNKARPKTFQDNKQSKPCPSIIDLMSADELKPCQYNNCGYIHSAVEYLKTKPKDLGDYCHIFNLKGRCPRGITCRFGSSHITAEGYNIVIEDKYKEWKDETKNSLQQSVQLQLQKKKYDFSFAERLVQASFVKYRNKKEKSGETQDKSLPSNNTGNTTENNSAKNEVGTLNCKEKIDNTHISKEGMNPTNAIANKIESNEILDGIQTSNNEESKNNTDNYNIEDTSTNPKTVTDADLMNLVTNSGAITDEDLIKLLPREKKVIEWKDKLYLSPLTTVGNLPFRRICKGFGADITCGEMALCEPLLKGMKQEWALVKRHECEDIFGAQICGNNVYVITKVAQLLQENTELDFIDLNLGCPIDLIYKQGGGSGMMHRLPALESSVRCASTLLRIPFTVKMRTGVYEQKRIAHNIMPKVAEWGASMITLHGRSREGRYTRSADWKYIESCAEAIAPCPVFGNGDIMSYDDYVQRRQLAPSVLGVMIGRGALIKPWIFTEIKEQKLWDIRSSERYDILKKFTNYGLEHWGSDTQGVENTRRFMLEWLSFLYRYVPVGLLERPPQKINERPPSYFGRDDLETLMASGNCADWVKISEMLLGPVPEGFLFLPKHKANSYQ